MFICSMYLSSSMDCTSPTLFQWSDKKASPEMDKHHGVWWDLASHHWFPCCGHKWQGGMGQCSSRVLICHHHPSRREDKARVCNKTWELRNMANSLQLWCPPLMTHCGSSPSMKLRDTCLEGPHPEWDGKVRWWGSASLRRQHNDDSRDVALKHERSWVIEPRKKKACPISC